MRDSSEVKALEREVDGVTRCEVSFCKFDAAVQVRSRSLLFALFVSLCLL